MHRVRVFALVMVLALGLWPAAGFAGATAGQPTEADKAAIRTVIEGQIAAFRKDDGPGAFAYAAPAIRQMFGNPDNFMKMVRAGYPSVYHPREYDFRDVVAVEGGFVQQVAIVGPDGVPVIALYTMERQSDGRWLIKGCTLARANETAA